MRLNALKRVLCVLENVKVFTNEHTKSQVRTIILHTD
jgi:hypothetical protein